MRALSARPGPPPPPRHELCNFRPLTDPQFPHLKDGVKKPVLASKGNWEIILPSTYQIFNDRYFPFLFFFKGGSWGEGKREGERKNPKQVP